MQLEVIGIDGRRVRTLVDASMTLGDHEVVWDGRDESGQAVAPGLYFDRLTSAGRTLSRRIVMTR